MLALAAADAAATTPATMASGCAVVVVVLGAGTTAAAAEPPAMIVASVGTVRLFCCSEADAAATIDERVRARTVRGDCFGGAGGGGDVAVISGFTVSSSDTEEFAVAVCVSVLTGLWERSASNRRSLSPRSRPQIGSKCFSFHGSSRLFSFSASVRIFIWFSGVNSPSDSRSRHSRHAREKNSLFKLDAVSRMDGTSSAPVLVASAVVVVVGDGDGRSTAGSNCTSLYWNSGGSRANVCLLSSDRKLAPHRIESGVSRSMQPSRVWAICAAVDIFLVVRRRGLRLKPGMEASTSRIVDACVTEVTAEVCVVVAVDLATAVVFFALHDVGLLLAAVVFVCFRRVATLGTVLLAAVVGGGAVATSATSGRCVGAVTSVTLAASLSIITAFRANPPQVGSSSDNVSSESRLPSGSFSSNGSWPVFVVVDVVVASAVDDEAGITSHSMLLTANTVRGIGGAANVAEQ